MLSKVQGVMFKIKQLFTKNYLFRSHFSLFLVYLVQLRAVFRNLLRFTTPFESSIEPATPPVLLFTRIEITTKTLQRYLISNN